MTLPMTSKNSQKMNWVNQTRISPNSNFKTSKTKSSRAAVLKNKDGRMPSKHSPNSASFPTTKTHLWIINPIEQLLLSLNPTPNSSHQSRTSLSSKWKGTHGSICPYPANSKAIVHQILRPNLVRWRIYWKVSKYISILLHSFPNIKTILLSLWFPVKRRKLWTSCWIKNIIWRETRWLMLWKEVKIYSICHQ